MKIYVRQPPNHERGNVLFLILIAVALFAALSYAVTNSSRFSNADSRSEKNATDVAQIFAIPTSYRMAAQRMMISKGMDAGEITALGPDVFDNFSANFNKTNIYHPLGGGMPYPIVVNTLMETGYDGTWAFNSETEVRNIGRSSPGSAASAEAVEVIAFLRGVKKSVCAAINAQLGISPMPESGADLFLNASAEPGEIMENGGFGVIGAVAGKDAQLAGKPEGCFQYTDDPGLYVFYAVIVPR